MSKKHISTENTSQEASIAHPNRPVKKGTRTAGAPLLKKWQRLVKHFFEQHTAEKFTIDELYQHLGAKTAPAKRYIQRVLKQLCHGQQLAKQNQYYLVRSKTLFSPSTEPFKQPRSAGAGDTSRVEEGEVDHVSPYAAYIVVPGREQDIRVRTAALNGAVHGDRVRVKIIKQTENGPQGRVMEIVQRRNPLLVGRLVQERGGWAVLPDHKRLHEPVLLMEPTEAQVSDKVVVKVKTWPSASGRPWQGVVQKVLGPVGSHVAEMDSILLSYDLPGDFPEEVEQAASAFPGHLSKEVLSKRRDFREVPTLTIDPDDAKDFDDALSIRPLKRGWYEVGVHIADVSHYVQEGSALDEEAFKRGNSIYLVDRTIPMLPERLSNNLCSLRPHEDRPAFSVVFTLDEQARIKEAWIGETVIHSKRRFTYEEAQTVIDTQEGDFQEELGQLHQLSQRLREQRFAGGAIDFSAPEVKVQLDDAGNPVGMRIKTPKPVHHLIEEFMLLANRYVAEHMQQQGTKQAPATFVYRTHDVPDEEKYQDFVRFVRQLGYTISPDRLKAAESIHYLNKELADSALGPIVQGLGIRTMAKALYSTHPDPHFGLGFAHYTHFTSPIRRYADLQVHRLLKRYLAKQPLPDATLYEEQSLHLVGQERLAMEAERASVRYKQVAFMETLQGQKLSGILSSLTEWGMYVTLLDYGCEGMIPVASLKDDYYTFDAKQFCLVGTRTQRCFRLGEAVTVQVQRCDITQRIVDLALVE